jgi:hypothetical protein
MGCGYYGVCEDCHIKTYLGYGSYGTWAIPDGTSNKDILDAIKGTMARTGKKRSDIVELDKNKNVIEFCKKHRGHKVVFYNDDVEDYYPDYKNYKEVELYGGKP